MRRRTAIRQSGLILARAVFMVLWGGGIFVFCSFVDVCGGFDYAVPVEYFLAEVEALVSEFLCEGFVF